MPTANKSTKPKSRKPNPGRTQTIPESVVERSLALSSKKAAQVWAQLNSDLVDPADLLPALQHAQSRQEGAVDIHVSLREHIKAELAAAQARLDALAAVHEADIKRLKGWAATLDQGVLDLYEQGLISDQTIGQTYRIRVKQNPPSCVVLDETVIPTQYIKVKTTSAPDRAAIKNAIQSGEEVPGASVVRKHKVVYEAAPTSLSRMTDQVQ